VLWHYLAHARVGVAPELKKEAARYLGVERLGQTRLRAALDEALQSLNAAGVRTVALKGPALGDRIYPGPSLRPSMDNDLLVTPADLDRAIVVWLYDSKLFLLRHPDLDWTVVSGRARSLGVARALSTALEAIHRRLSAPVHFVPPLRVQARVIWPLIAITARQPYEP